MCKSGNPNSQKSTPKVESENVVLGEGQQTPFPLTMGSVRTRSQTIDEHGKITKIGPTD